MKTSVLAIAVTLVAAAAFGVSLKDLNIARDPEDLDGAIYAKAVYDLDLRAGPGLNFPKIGFVPAGADVPIIGWIERDSEDGFWFRTQYEGIKGWLCSTYEGTRLVERDGGPVFKVSVAVDKLKFNWLKDPGRRDWEDIWLTRGEELEFLTAWGSNPFSPAAEDFCFFVKYGDKLGYVYVYGNGGGYPRFEVEPPPGPRSSWFVDYPPELLDLSLLYYRDLPLFEFVGPEERRVYYSGPGFDYAEDESVFLHYSVYFLEGNWALVWSYNEWSWVYVGTEEEPNVQMTYRLAGGLCPLPDKGDYRMEDGDLEVSLSRDYWPANPRIYATLSAAYFCEYKEAGVVDSVDIYQPPESNVPVFSASAGTGENDWWHETYILEYELAVPESVDLDAPFRAVARMHYKGAQKFEMEFNCNPPR